MENNNNNIRSVFTINENAKPNILSLKKRNFKVIKRANGLGSFHGKSTNKVNTFCEYLVEYECGLREYLTEKQVTEQVRVNGETFN